MVEATGLRWRTLSENGPLTGILAAEDVAFGPEIGKNGVPIRLLSMEESERFLASFARKDGREGQVYSDECPKGPGKQYVEMGYNEACDGVPAHWRIAMAIDPTLYAKGREMVEFLRDADGHNPANRKGLTSSALLYSFLKDGADKEEWGEWLNTTQKAFGYPIWDILSTDEQLYAGDMFVKDTEYGAGRNRYIDIMLLDEKAHVMFKQAFGGNI